MVMIIVTKKINSKACPITPTAASAIAMAIMAIPRGSSVAATAPKSSSRMNQRDGNAESLPLLQVMRAHLVVLEGYAGVAADEHAEVIRFVGFLDDVKEVLDVRCGLLRASSQGVMHQDCSLAGGNQERQQLL